MISPDKPLDEAARLADLRSCQVLDTVPEAGFDDLVQIAARLADAPIALVSLVDAERQWFKARLGLEATETPREISFCGHVVADDATLVVPDASRDPRFDGNPLVLRGLKIRFYAGAPIRSAAGRVLGTLCVIDTRPRRLVPDRIRLLEALAAQAASLLDLRRRILAQERFITTVSHELRTPLTTVRGSLGLVLADAMGPVPGEIRELLRIAAGSVERLVELVNVELQRLETQLPRSSSPRPSGGPSGDASSAP